MFTVSSIWAALPNGQAGQDPDRRLRLSVAVALRLGSDNPAQDDPHGAMVSLASFPLAADWATTMTGVGFTVEIDGVGSKLATVVSPAPDPAVWRALFPPAAGVRLHTLDDYTGRTVSTYPNAAVARTLQHGYLATFGASPIDPPRHRVLAQAFPELHAALTATEAGADLDTAARTRAAVRLDPATANDATLRAAHAHLTAALLSGSGEAAQLERLAAAARIAQRIAQRNGRAYTPLIPAGHDPVSAFTQLLAFHRCPSALARHPASDGLASPATGQPEQTGQLAFDVHQAFSLLADYPLLLRMLGLVVDLEIPADALPPSPLTLKQPRRLRVHPGPADRLAGAAPYLPWTAYTLDGDKIFCPAPRPGQPTETVAGLLNLALPDTYHLLQIDVDGGALGALAALNNPGDVAAGLPTLRTAGISLSRTDRGPSLQERFAAALTSDEAMHAGTGTELTLYDLDVIRGYRLDVCDIAAGRWRSLHQRRGRYTFPAHQPQPLTLELADEATAQPSVTDHPAVGAGAPPLFVHESLARWQGWSLAVPRPGKAVGDAGPTEVTSSPPPDGFQLQTSFTSPPGALPRLRFGRSYQLRARTVDLAGNSLTIEQADAIVKDFGSLGRPVPVLPADPAGLRYQRFEPVTAPVLVLRERPSEGESLERLVLRSNAGEDTASCAGRLRAAVRAARPDTRIGYLPVNERHVLPPKAAHSTTEAFGLFDPWLGPGKQHDTAYNIALRDGGLTDTHIIDTATGTLVAIPDTTGTDPVTGLTSTRPSVEPAGDTGAVAHHEDALQLPYLPDPLSHGAALFGLPGLAPGQAATLRADGSLVIGPTPLSPSTGLPAADPQVLGSITQIPFGGDWPQRLPWRLRLAEPPGPSGAPAPPPQWNNRARVLTVYLARAQQATVRLASFLGPGDIDLLGQWGWLVDSLKAQKPSVTLDAAALQLATCGALWLLTPARTITLVHAVQQPLTPPTITNLRATRAAGDTGAYLGGTISVHGRSSAKLDLLADWQETIDRLDEPGPRVISGQAHVYEIPIHLPEDTPANPPPTAARPIATYDATHDTLTLIAPDTPTPATTVGGRPVGDRVPNGEGPPFPPPHPPGAPHPPPRPPRPPADDRPYSSRQAFGDTKHRTINYRAVATTRFREYFPPEVTGNPQAIVSAGPPVAVRVLSSARPQAPRITGCLPAMRWERPTGPFGTHTRHGNTLRILLARPRCSSGDGELLGVLTATPDTNPPDAQHRPYLSHWGTDPIWQTTTVPPLTPNLFVNPTASATLTLPELAAATKSAGNVQVTGYAVSYDHNRRLWYADITLNAATTYRPLVRLAVAGYQPNSLPGYELSPAVTTDLIQLLPDRTVTITPVQGNPNQVKVRIDGLTYHAAAWPGPPDLPGDAFAVRGIEPVPKLLEVRVEQRIPGGSDVAAWRPAPASLGANITIDHAALATGQTGTDPLWAGLVTLPASRAPGELRLVVVEREHLTTDRSVAYSYKETTHEGPGGRPVTSTVHSHYWPGDGRITFAETITW